MRERERGSYGAGGLAVGIDIMLAGGMPGIIPPPLGIICMGGDTLLIIPLPIAGGTPIAGDGIARYINVKYIEYRIIYKDVNDIERLE